MLPTMYPGPRIGGDALYQGFTIGEILKFTTPGVNVFDKSLFPGIRAVLVECQAAGGGVPTISGVTSTGDVVVTSGGSGGAYVRSLVLATDLANTESVTVPVSGSGINGADAVFDTISGEVRAKGGLVGVSSGVVVAASGYAAAVGSTPPAGNVGDIIIHGAPSFNGIALSATRVFPGRGGDSFLGWGGQPGIVTGASGTVTNGLIYGGGAGGNGRGQNQSGTGSQAAGAQGIVIVTVLY